MSKYQTEDEAIKAARAKAEQEVYVDFDGQNCDEDRNCMGWDGEDNRCDCGNRRVQWSTYQHDDGSWYAYAAAY